MKLLLANKQIKVFVECQKPNNPDQRPDQGNQATNVIKIFNCSTADLDHILNPPFCFLWIEK